MIRNEKNPLLFSRKEKAGVAAILLLNLIIWLIPQFYERSIASDQNECVTVSSLQNDLTLKAEKQTYVHYLRDSNSYSHQKTSQIQLFNFDPNTCSDTEWKKLGLPEKVIRTIRNYLSKGGRFRKPEDLEKIWGIKKQQFQLLLPYVQIQSKNIPKLKNSQQTQGKHFSYSFIDINIADSAAFESLPGIGPSLSARIVKYRDKLGGFYEVSQMNEVWGLTDSVFSSIKDRLLVQGEVSKIDINLADFKQFSSHPYIGFQSAKLLLNYRKQHGRFESLDEIQKIILLDEKSFNKALHYLIVK